MADRDANGRFKKKQCGSKIRWFDTPDLKAEFEDLREEVIQCTLPSRSNHKVHRQGDKESHIRWNNNDPRVVKD